ncbi:MAG: AsmA family protein [Desulfurivibrionaceae bacterium]|nr:AsmA family protein [Desulfurivibrionaceae bacterium]
MAKFFKYLLVFTALLMVILVAATLALRAYLTDDRIRAMIIPPMERMLGRTVDIGRVKVSLFTGIQVYDLEIKEEDGQDNFISASHFVLSYDLLPLLQKKVLIRDIRLVKPAIAVVRDEQGVFNFSTLALLDKKEGSAPEPSAQEAEGGPALPFTVEVKNLSVEEGTVHVQDALGEIPTMDVVAQADISLEMGRTLADLRYQGTASFVVDTVYRGLALRQEGQLDFDQQKLNFLVDLSLDQQSLHFSGSVVEFMDTSKLPPIIVNVSGQEVDVDQLLASLALLSAKEEKTQDGPARPAPAPAKKSGPLVPADLQVKGEVGIAKARYQGMVISDIHLNYTLAEGIFTLSDLSGQTMGGEMEGEALVHLQEVPTYEGKVGLAGLQLDELLKTFVADSPAQASGALSGAMTFSGRGISPEEIKKEISGLGEFSMQEARITGAEFTKTLASLLDLPELTDLELQDMAGDFAIEKGVAQVRSRVKSDAFNATMAGQVGLDGHLDLPVSLSLSPRLSSRLESRLQAARYMEKEGERIRVDLVVGGMVDSPKVTLDTSQVRRQATESLIDKALGEDATPEEKEAGEAVKGLLENIFGK